MFPIRLRSWSVTTEVFRVLDNLFLSVGAMKAGTTWLYEQLKMHPDIYFTPEKEIHYFANIEGIEGQLSRRNRLAKLKSKIDESAGKDLAWLEDNMGDMSWYFGFADAENIDGRWYESLFRLKGGEKYCADFSNLYCQMDEKGWMNVRRVANNVKAIYTLRDPLKRLWSHYKFHMLWIGREDEVLGAGFDEFRATLDKHWFWVNAEYARNYRFLVEALQEDEIMLLYFEDFREDPRAMLARVQRFLEISEVEPSEERVRKRTNVTKEIEIPEQWRDYMVEKLRPVCNDLKELGLYHEKWVSI